MSQDCSSSLRIFQVVEPKPIVDEETEVVLKARDFAMMVGYFMGYTQGKLISMVKLLGYDGYDGNDGI